MPRALAIAFFLGISVPAAAQTPAPAPAEARPTDDVLRRDAPRAVLPPGAPEDDLGEPSLLATLLRMVLVLALVIGLVYLSLNFGLRRLMNLQPSAAALVKVHDRVMLEPKKSLYLVEAADEFLLLGVGDGEVNLVAKLDADRVRAKLAERKPAATEPARPFWERLKVPPPSRTTDDKDSGKT